MRSRTSFFIVLFAVSFLALPLAAHAGGIPFFGPIIDKSWFIQGPNGAVQCALGWGAIIIVINNLISFLLTLAIVFVAPLMIAWSGFLFVVNPVKPEGKEQAKKILLNTIVGIVIALAGWLIVDALMAVLYNPTAVGGTWSSLISTGGQLPCLPQAGVGTGLSQAPATGITTGTVPPVGIAKGPCDSGNTACSTSAIQQGAQALNPALSLSSAQLTAMSCIAMTESSGRPNTPDSSTGACGTFQITNRPGNWSNAVFHQSPCSTSSSCNDAQCNMQTALIMFRQQGYQPWTGKNPNGTYWNANAVACVQQYDPSAGLRL